MPPTVVLLLLLLCACSGVAGTTGAGAAGAGVRPEDGGTGRFRVHFEWSHLNYTWPSADAYSAAVAAGRYVPESNVPVGVAHWAGQLYVAVARARPGVPATLARVPSSTEAAGGPAPPLRPFPSWRLNAEGDCAALQSAHAVQPDADGRLWVLDAGGAACPPSIVVLQQQHPVSPQDPVSDDADEWSVSVRHELPAGCVPRALVLDDADGGHAYVADGGADPGIVVFSMRRRSSWKVRHAASMRASPDAAELTVGGVTVTLAAGHLQALALGPRRAQHGSELIVSLDRALYYCPLASRAFYAVDTADLRDARPAAAAAELPDARVRRLGLKASQSAAMAMDERGALYYGLLTDHSVARWDSAAAFTYSQRVVARDRDRLQWAAAFSFVDGGARAGDLLVLTNRLQRALAGRLNASEPNFRVLRAAVGARSYLHGAGPPQLVARNKTQGQVNAEGGTENMNSSLHYSIRSSPHGHWHEYGAAGAADAAGTTGAAGSAGANLSEPGAQPTVAAAGRAAPPLLALLIASAAAVAGGGRGKQTGQPFL